MSNIKSWLTDIVALGAAIFAAIQAYLGTLGGGDINWFQLIATVITAIIAFFTGRNGDGSKKKVPAKS